MSRFAAVDLSSLPAPDVVETVAFEAALAALKADFVARCTAASIDYTALDLESDPVAKLLEAAAYREVLLRQRVNDAARARNLVFAAGADLDALGADQGCYRLTLAPATTDTAAILESDDDFRRRIQLAPESLSTAGCEGGYVYNALTAGDRPVGVSVASPDASTVVVTYTFDPSAISALIKDASATRPAPGSVLVCVLGRAGDGSVDAATIAKVEAALSATSVRPLCDEVTVQSAEIRTYAVTAALEIYDGLDATTIKTASGAALATVAKARHMLGESVTDSVVKAALHVAGVKTVTLSGWSDVVCDDTQAPYLTGSTLTTITATA